MFPHDTAHGLGGSAVCRVSAPRSGGTGSGPDHVVIPKLLTMLLVAPRFVFKSDFRGRTMTGRPVSVKCD